MRSMQCNVNVCFNFKLWHPRCVLIAVYKEWYQVVKHNYIYLAM